MSNIANMHGALYTEAMGITSGASGAFLQTIREARKLEPKGMLPRFSKRLGNPVDHSQHIAVGLATWGVVGAYKQGPLVRFFMTLQS